MFRAPVKKKKQKKAVTRLQADSDDDDNDELATTRRSEADTEGSGAELRNAIRSKKSKKKKKGLVIRSFDVQEGDNADLSKSDTKKKSKKRKRAGLGFGGGGLNIVDEDDEILADQSAASEKISSPLYGKGALEKLKAEQKYKAPPPKDDTQSNVANDSSVQQYSSPRESQAFNGRGPNQHINVDYVAKNSSPAPNDDDDFIPLSNSKEPSMILTGDEAMLFESRNGNEKEEKEDHFDTVMEDSNVFDDSAQQEQAEEASAWEAEITRRAGIQEKKTDQSSKPTSVLDSISRGGTSVNGTSSAMSLAKLRSQIQSTVSQLETQENDVERACQRRRVELTQTKEELGRQEAELAEAGKALEDYQELREQLAFWTGALRDLRNKVKPIQEAFVDLDADVASCYQCQDWEDDMCSVLHQAGLLDRVLGRQPPDTVFEDATTIVDEFGRDVKSQQAMHREKRTKRRLEIHRQRQQTREDDSDAFSTQEEIGDFRERLLALTNAVKVAVEELEEEYTNLSSLVKIFKQWQTSYPEDYKQCFANLSLGDLASVLVQVDLCKVNPENSSCKGWLESLTSDTEKSDARDGWANALADLGAKENATGPSASSMEVLDRLMEKTYIALLTDILDKSAYNLISKKQSRSLSSLYAQLAKVLQPADASRNHEGLVTITNRLLNYIKAAFNNVAIVILKKRDDCSISGDVFDLVEDSNYKKEELQSAMRGATIGQLHRLSKMLLNALIYWAPHLGDRGGFVEFLLDFLSNKFLFLLSSRREDIELTSAIFSEVWNVLQGTKWLERPELMLHAAPVRAAAAAFNLS